MQEHSAGISRVSLVSDVGRSCQLHPFRRQSGELTCLAGTAFAA